MRTTKEHRELYSMLCGDLNGKEIQKKKDICVPQLTQKLTHIVRQLFSNQSLKAKKKYFSEPPNILFLHVQHSNSVFL